MGGTKALAQRLELTERAAEYRIQRCVKRTKLANEMRRLVE